nr:hypothetical protein [Kofleriaceae bacterium]
MDFGGWKSSLSLPNGARLAKIQTMHATSDWPKDTTFLAPEILLKTVVEDGGDLFGITEGGDVLKIPTDGSPPRCLAKLDPQHVELAHGGGNLFALVSTHKSSLSILRLATDGQWLPVASRPYHAINAHIVATLRGLLFGGLELACFPGPTFDTCLVLDTDSRTRPLASPRGAAWVARRYDSEHQSTLFELRNSSLEPKPVATLPTEALDYSIRLEVDAAFFFQLEESWVRGPMAGEARQSLVMMDLASGALRTIATGIHNASGLRITPDALYVECLDKVRDEVASHRLMAFS